MESVGLRRSPDDLDRLNRGLIAFGCALVVALNPMVLMAAEGPSPAATPAAAPGTAVAGTPGASGEKAPPSSSQASSAGAGPPSSQPSWPPA